MAISPETVTVLGRNVKATDAAWLGLDLDGADLLIQATIMWVIIGSDAAPVDLHLRAPWWHPDDGPRPDPPEMYYRVRPRMKVGKRWRGDMVKSVAFERWDGKWRLAVEVDDRKKAVVSASSHRA